MASITTIVRFEMPEENTERFFSLWQKIRDEVVRQPGIIGGFLHRGVDEDAPFRFINVARWESAEALESGLGTVAETLQREQGIAVREAYEEPGVKMTQNNYTEEGRYFDADGTSSN